MRRRQPVRRLGAAGRSGQVDWVAALIAGAPLEDIHCDPYETQAADRSTESRSNWTFTGGGVVPRVQEMLLEDKTAVVYGGGGVIGGATVRAHTDSVAAAGGGIDIAFNAVGIPHVQGMPFAELSVADYLHPITAFCRSNFVTAQAVTRHMVEQRSGVILTISTLGSRTAFPGTMGYAATCAALEATTRVLAAELGPSGVRAVCLMSDMIPEAAAMGSYSHDVFEPIAERMGLTMDEFLASPADRSLLDRWPSVSDVAEAAVFVASDRAAAMTGTVVNLTAGSHVD